MSAPALRLRQWITTPAARRAAGAAIVLAGGLAAACEAPYINWRPVVPPIDARPLVIRQDAGGDGWFEAPRSGNRKHRGVDLAAGLQTPVRAIRSGRVREARFHRGLGWYVELEHGGGLESLYAHLHDLQVTRGMRVRQGDLIGTVGKTGNARRASITPHLHFEVHRHGAPVDPQTLGFTFAQAHSVADPSDASGGE